MTVDTEPAVPKMTTEDRSIANAQGALDVVQATGVRRPIPELSEPSFIRVTAR
jgi:hypothetical protein